MRKIIIAAIVAMLASGLYAQNPTDNRKKKKEKTIELFGNVYDSFTKGKLKAFVTLMRPDSTIVDTTTCHVGGNGSSYSWYDFEVPRAEGKYIIKTSLDGYYDQYTDYEVKNMGRKYQFQVPRILMKRRRDSGMDGKELNELVVHGTRVQIAYKGDTIVYDAAAFNLPEGSMLDGLIRQLPGAEIKENGDIYVNGKKIDNLMLNGKDFFKGDNKVMLENLPYFTVKNVQVYHKSTEKSEMMGHDIEAKEYVMDVNLKREYAHGYIANAEAGGGTEERWMGRLFGLFYDDHTRVSAFANMNNVNENRSPGSDGNWQPANMPRGLLTTRQTGMTLQTEDKDKNVRDNFNTTLTWSDADNASRTALETFSTGGSIFGRSSSFSRNRGFFLNGSNTLRMNKIHLFMLTRFYYNTSDASSSANDSTSSGTALMNHSTRLNKSNMKQFRIMNMLSWYKNFSSGDYLSFSLNTVYDTSKPNESFGMNKTTFTATGEDDLRNSYADNHTSSYSYDIRASYRFTLPNKWEIGPSFTYYQEHKSVTSNHFRLDWLNNDIYEEAWLLPSTRDSLMMALDGDNSYSKSEMTRQYNGAIYLSKFTDKMSASISLPVNHEVNRMSYFNSVLDTVSQRSNTTFEPNVYISTYGKNPIRFEYHLDVFFPEFETLMPTFNNTNPLNIRINNPGLKNRTRHKGEGQITFNNDSIGSSFYVGFDFLVMRNAWGTRTTYNSETGAYTRMTDNVDGTWSTSLKSGWQRPIDSQKRFRLDISGSVKYERSVDFDIAYDTDADVLSRVTNIYTRLNGKLSYRLNKFSAAIVSKLVMRNSTGDRANFENINTYDYQYGGNIQYTIPMIKLTVATDINMFSRRGYNSGMMNTDDLVWNAQLTRSFFKGRLTAKVQAFDLLHQLSNVRYNINAQGRTETWYNCIPRYVMLTAAYKFTKKPNKK